MSDSSSSLENPETFVRFLRADMPCFLLENLTPTAPTITISKSGWWGIAFSYVSDD